MRLEVKSDCQKSSAWLKSLFRAVYVQGHETNFGFLGLQDTPKKFSGTFQGLRGHAQPEKFENEASQID